MIGVMVPSAFAETYVHDDPKFSIDYPLGWIVDDSQNFEDFGVLFTNSDESMLPSTTHVSKLDIQGCNEP